MAPPQRCPEELLFTATRKTSRVFRCQHRSEYMLQCQVSAVLQHCGVQVEYGVLHDRCQTLKVSYDPNVPQHSASKLRFRKSMVMRLEHISNIHLSMENAKITLVAVSRKGVASPPTLLCHREVLCGKASSLVAISWGLDLLLAHLRSTMLQV